MGALILPEIFQRCSFNLMFYQLAGQHIILLIFSKCIHSNRGSSCDSPFSWIHALILFGNLPSPRTLLGLTKRCYVACSFRVELHLPEPVSHICFVFWSKLPTLQHLQIGRSKWDRSHTFFWTSRVFFMVCPRCTLVGDVNLWRRLAFNVSGHKVDISRCSWK